MDQALTFHKVIPPEGRRELSFSVAAGSLAAVIGGDQEENDLQVRLMLGLADPESGSITVLGKELASASDRARSLLRREMAVVFATGGLVSNLKVWENLVLPLEYHALCSQAEIEERVAAALARVGYAGGTMELPAHLSLYQRRQVGLARAILTGPRLVVYNGILDGLSGGERGSLAAVATAFHRESPGRTSLFLASHEETVREIPLESRIVIRAATV